MNELYCSCLLAKTVNGTQTPAGTPQICYLVRDMRCILTIY